MAEYITGVGTFLGKTVCGTVAGLAGGAINGVYSGFVEAFKSESEKLNDKHKMYLEELERQSEIERKNFSKKSQKEQEMSQAEHQKKLKLIDQEAEQSIKQYENEKRKLKDIHDQNMFKLGLEIEEAEQVYNQTLKKITNENEITEVQRRFLQKNLQSEREEHLQAIEFKNNDLNMNHRLEMDQIKTEFEKDQTKANNEYSKIKNVITQESGIRVVKVNAQIEDTKANTILYQEKIKEMKEAIEFQKLEKEFNQGRIVNNPQTNN